MLKLLIVLVILADPNLQPMGDALSSRLVETGGERVKVLAGKEAIAELHRRGVQDADLVAGPGIGTELTSRSRELAVVRLERLDRGGDSVVEARIWLAGRQESAVAIAGERDGKPGDAADTAVRSIANILTPWISDTASGGAVQAPPLARFADRGEWQAIVDAVAKMDKPGARDLYYLVLARVRQGRADDAAAAFARLKAGFPDHVLLGAAQALVSPAAKAAAENDINDPTSDDGGNVLR